MNRSWRKYLGLTAGLLASCVQAADPAAVSGSREVIARTPAPIVAPASSERKASPPPPQRNAATQDCPAVAGSVSRSIPEVRPLAASLERPRFAADRELQQAAFQTEARPIIRAQAGEFAPPPTLLGSEGAPLVSSPVGPTPSFEGLAYSDPAINFGTDTADRFAPGDGVVQNFNDIFEIESEYLFWKTRGQKVPALLTTGMMGGTLADPTASVLFGGGSQQTDAQSGWRGRLGFWFDRDHAVGLEFGYFFLAQSSNRFAAASNGIPPLFIPFFNGTTGSESAAVLADANAAGGAVAELKERLWGYEVNLKTNLWNGPIRHVDLLLGYRGMGLDNSLDFGVTRMIDPSLSSSDSFATRNRFQGAQIGAVYEAKRGPWSLGITGKFALGVNDQQVEINGVTLTALPSATVGGVFTDRTNIGRFTRNRFSTVSELGAKIGYQFTDSIRGTVGYNFIYWSDTARAGEQIDRVLIGTNRPAFTFRESDFWVQGLTLGLEMRY